MAVTWTKEQQKVIELRDRSILVSAAAGSGKTAVLVQRILGKILDKTHPVDIDRLLIMTFTRAAAGEMRERISKALEDALYENPDNEHLQRQMTLIHTAQITTIDGFCSWLIRNYFHLTDLDPGYRLVDEGEQKLLRDDVWKELQESLYQEHDDDFRQFVECYATGKTDETIKGLVLQVYDAAMSNPWPEEWLQDASVFYRTETMEELRDSEWMQLLWQLTGQELAEAVRLVKEGLAVCRQPGGPYLYEEAFQSDLQFLETLESLQSSRDYDGMVQHLQELSFARLSTARQKDVEPAFKEQAKELREEEKDILRELASRYFTTDETQLLRLIQYCNKSVETLVRAALLFKERFAARKREKNLLDFTDLEHFALKILLPRDEDGTVHPSQAARELSAKYEEVLVDEYQDSNLLQELLTASVSGWVKGKKNIFMVGDVKQSIYRFRLARPELFMEKYRTFTLEDGEEQRIDLHKNFRSRPEVLASVNYLFRRLMGEDMGGIRYDDAAALYPGAVFPEIEGILPDVTTEILVVEKDGELLSDEQNMQNDRELEALALGHRILDLVGKAPVWDKDTQNYRPAQFGDIVVLLRTASGWAEPFSKVFESLGIPSYTASRTGYFSATEVVIVLNYLRVSDNPLQDIPLAGVLRSPIVGLTSEELAEIRAEFPQGMLYESVLDYTASKKDALKQKLEDFLTLLQKTRDRAEFTPIHQLIAEVLRATGYGDYVKALPGGEQRSANLRMLVEKAMEYERTSYRGLFNFVRYIEQLHKSEVDFGEVNLAGAGNASVQIMTIHKSKGLEFPIVFLAGMGKQFNFSDIYAQLLIHPEMGIGVDAVFPEKRLMVSTLPKQVIRRELLRENLGEELRVLYVALTRAKEKLILIGTIDKLEKRVRALSHFTDVDRDDSSDENVLPIAVRMKAKSNWDFVLPALAGHPCMRELFLHYGILPGSHLQEAETPPKDEDAAGAAFALRVIPAEELARDTTKTQMEAGLREMLLKDWNPEMVFDPDVRGILEKRFSYKYPYDYLREIPAKVSVSDLKKRSYTDDEEKESALYVEHDLIPLVPQFMAGGESETYTGAARGTAYHRVMECLDYHEVFGKEEIQKQILALVEQKKLTEEEAACVRPEDILTFLASPVGERMRLAGISGRLYREQPFVISERASCLDERWDGDETVLVQGIIDAYFQEGEGLVLVDYKTDKVFPGQEQHLVDLYHVQLEDYAAALERLTDCKVKEKYIYSFTLGKEIRLE